MTTTKSTPTTVLEVKAVLTSYMRLAHEVDLLKVDMDLLERLVTSAEAHIAPASEVTPEVSVELAQIVDITGKRVRMALPAGFPVVKTVKRNAYYADTPIGRPPVAVKFVDLAHMVTTEALERSVGVTAKALVDLEVGMLIPTSVVTPEVTPDVNASPPPAPAPKVDVKAVTKKVKRQIARESDHARFACTCQRPPGHECPAVVDYGKTILPLEMVLEKIAQAKADAS